MKGIILIILLAYNPLSKASEENDTALFSPGKTTRKNMTILEKWDFLEKRIKFAANSATKFALPFLMDNFPNMNLSKECVTNSLHLLSGLKNIKPWALRFVDSSAKSIDGILLGTMTSFGSYDECMETEVKSTRLKDKGKLLFKGQYCALTITLPLPPLSKVFKLFSMQEELKNISHKDTVTGELSKYAHSHHRAPLLLGICTPTGCSTDDLNKIVNSLEDEIFPLNVSIARCESKEETKLTPVQKFVIFCYSFAGILVLIGSLIDVCAHYKIRVFKSKLIRILVAFSFLVNFKRLTNMKTGSEALSCINGIRFLSMTWIILGHTYLGLASFLLQNSRKTHYYIKDFAFQVVLNGTFVVDTFFLISGFLLCYVTIKMARNHGGKLNIFTYILHRIWRIVPAYFFATMFMFLLNLFGSGPLWNVSMARLVPVCYKTWWTNLLFINNFYDAPHMCNIAYWYLAVDFQLYIGALIILLPMIRWPKIGMALCVLGVIASVIYAGIGTYVNDYLPGLLIAQVDYYKLAHYWNRFYSRPFIHVGPYCVGLLAGYIFATKPDLKISPMFQILGWSLAFISNFSVVYGVVEWNRGAEIRFWPSIFYASFSRTAWSIGIAWMVICCATGHGGIINYILSWKIFIPLGRLSFIAYLAHTIVLFIELSSLTTVLQPGHFIAVWLYFGNLCVTYGIAFVGNMLIEAPFMSLEKILLSGNKKQDEIAMKENNLNGNCMTDKTENITAFNTSPDKGVSRNEISVKV